MDEIASNATHQERLDILCMVAESCLEEIPGEITQEVLESDDQTYGIWQEYKKFVNWIEALQKELCYGSPID